MNQNGRSSLQETLLSPDKSVYHQGDAVLRPSGPWTHSIHSLLKHLEQTGFSAAPRVIGTGIAQDGRETLSYVERELVHPYAWSDEALVKVGQLLRQLHDATRSFVPPQDAIWKPWFLRELGDSRPVYSHGDVAPWNMVTQAGMPVALIDWEYAGPVDPLVELARVCWLFPQLCDDDIAELWGLPSLTVRARQLRVIADAYGASIDQRRVLLDHILEVAVREAAADAIEAKVTSESVGQLWGLAWRIRSAAWIMRHRAILARALEC